MIFFSKKLGKQILNVIFVICVIVETLRVRVTVPGLYLCSGLLSALARRERRPSGGCRRGGGCGPRSLRHSGSLSAGFGHSAACRHATISNPEYIDFQRW